MTRIIQVGDMPDSGLSLGCDVSYCQRPERIDWTSKPAVSEGINWAMVRTGYGSMPDSTTVAHWCNARKASLSVGGYHFVTEAPAYQQIETMLAQLKRVCQGDDIAPCLDLEWLPDGRGGRLPHDKAAYCATVEAMFAALTREWGGCWVYSCIGFWQAVGAPKSWLDLEWWVPYYPRPGFSEADARRSTWPQRPGIPTPAAWQYGCPNAEWGGSGQVDRNLARRLPFIVEVP